MKEWSGIIKAVAVALLTGALAWGAWVTLGVAGAANEDRVTDKFDQVQTRIEDKLDDIQQTILNLHKE
jgi:hypothetical protein